MFNFYKKTSQVLPKLYKSCGDLANMQTGFSRSRWGLRVSKSNESTDDATAVGLPTIF